MRTTLRTEDDILVNIPNKVTGSKRFLQYCPDCFGCLWGSGVVLHGPSCPVHSHAYLWHSATLPQMPCALYLQSFQHKLSCAIALHSTYLAPCCTSCCRCSCRHHPQTVADMIVFNRSATISRSRLATANRKTEPLKLKIKVPYAAAEQLGPLQSIITEVLCCATAAGVGAVAAESGSSTTSSSSGGSTTGTTVLSVEHAGMLLKEGSVEIQVSKFTDAGLELLVKVRPHSSRRGNRCMFGQTYRSRT